MAHVGSGVILVMMAFAIIGACAAAWDDQRGLGKEFVAGLHSIGPIFLPVAGIMASAPYLSAVVSTVFGPLFAALGGDPAIAATTLIAVDMGGYQLAHALAGSPESWIVASTAGFMAGATLVFSIPVGLAMLDRRDHPYLALGMMAGLPSIPVGVGVACGAIALFDPAVREGIATTGEPTRHLSLGVGAVAATLVPLALFCGTLAVGLRAAPELMIRLFLCFGRLVYGAIMIVVALSIVQYFTGLPGKLLGGWHFAPIIADAQDQFRALEIAGYIGIMLAGAFPMVAVINRHLARPMEALGRRLGLSASGAAGILAAAANILAMYRLCGAMRPRDKVVCIAFSVCAAFSFGDHLAFAANFQPSLIPMILLGKIGGGLAGIGLAHWLSVPAADRLVAAAGGTASEALEAASHAR